MSVGNIGVVAQSTGHAAGSHDQQLDSADALSETVAADTYDSPAPAPMSIEAELIAGLLDAPSERDPLLRRTSSPRTRKPFYRPRPLWIVPFAFAAAVARGMTMAPRVEVFTQLACIAVHGPPIDFNHTVSHAQAGSMAENYIDRANYIGEIVMDQAVDDDADDPMHLPSQNCLSDPAVQSRAAGLQTIMTITMGALSAITTGWWGHVGERHGRTRVLAVASFSLMITDVVFLLVSIPHSPFSSHGHKLLIVAPIIEGLLGGWATLQAAAFSYISDCTSDGSRAHIFSRFTGVFYVGFATGPMIAAFIISHSSSFPIASTPSGSSVAPVFWVAVLCSLINFFLSAFVFPESLHKRKGPLVPVLAPNDAHVPSLNETAESPKPSKGAKGLLKPLAIVFPRKIEAGDGSYRKDWSLTLLVLALLGYYLASGIFQIKYLYAKHMFGWNAEQLSYYISFVGGARALTVLLLLPAIISIFKPKHVPSSAGASQLSTSGNNAKPKMSRSQLMKEISFDLGLARSSFVIDLMSHTLVSLSHPAPTSSSQAFFVAFTSMSSLSTGAVPAIQSLALCILQLRDKEDVSTGDTGSLFGALAMLLAIGQMILGPMLFGLVYSSTVAHYPKTIFLVAASIMTASLASLIMVRPPIKRVKPRRLHAETAVETERGRSRVSKDLSRRSSNTE